MKRTYTILILVLALSAALRVYTVYTESLPSFDDEIAHYVYAAYYHAFGVLPDFAWSKSMEGEVEIHGKTLDTQQVYTYQNYQMPLYYMLASQFVGFGTHGVRLFSVALVILGAALLMPYVQDRVAWCAFLLLPGSIAALSVITNQSFMFFATCLFSVAWIKKKEALWFVAVMILAMAKVTGIVMLVGAFAFLLVRRKEYGYLIPPTGLAIITGSAVAVFRLGLDRSNSHLYSAITNIPAWITRLSDTFVSGMFHPALTSGSLLVLPVAVFFVIFLGYWVWRSITRDHLGLLTYSAGAALIFIFGFMGTSSFGQGRWFYAMVPLFVTMGYGIHSIREVENENSA